MSRAVQILEKVLTEIGWEPEPNDESSFFIDFGPPHMPIADALAAVLEDSQRFIFYINFGLAVLPERYDEVARFITRANWGLSIGNFEMDYDDGHVRFKSSLDFQGLELTETLIRNTILPAMHAVEVYGEPLIDVIARRKDASSAVHDAEPDH